MSQSTHIDDEILNNDIAVSAPGVTNDASQGYSVGSRWTNITADKAYLCVDNTNAAAVWIGITDIEQTPVVKTAAYTAIANDSILADTDTTGSFTITLPESASVGDVINIYDAKGTFNTANITIARNGHNIRGVTANLTLDVNWGHVKLVYIDTTTGWRY